MTRCLFLLALALAAALPCAAQPAAGDPSPLAAAGWCTLTGDGDTAAPPAPGCDMGLGLALHRRGRVAVVGVLGTQTLGVGLAWTVNPGAAGPVLAIGAGFVARYDAAGIAADIHPAIGCTLSFGRSQEP